MLRIPTANVADRDRGEFLKFLGICRDAAIEDGHFKIASISIGVKHLDPLAVLESIYEPHEQHFYLEQPNSGFAIAGAEAVVTKQFSGKRRFEDAKVFTDEILEHTIAVGNLEVPFAGPHFFSAFTFFDTVSDDAYFSPGCVFFTALAGGEKGWILQCCRQCPCRGDFRFRGDCREGVEGS